MAAKEALVRLSRDFAYADTAARAKAFVDLAFATLPAKHMTEAREALQRHPNSLVAKAAAHALADDIWNGEDARALAAAYIESIADGSVLDSVARYASMIPIGSRRVMIAADFVGDIVAEGTPKPVKQLSLSIGDIEPLKAAALVVLTRELALVLGGRALFETELRKAVTRAVNASFLGALVNSDTIDVASTGDALSDLRAGLQAAGPSEGFVVVAPSGAVADLATRTENRGGMSVRGGEFISGISVVAVDGITGMHVIPASRFALWDGGLTVSAAGHADVDLRAEPESPAVMTNLWQTNSVGLLAERSWHLAQAAEVVVVGGAS